ncbi:hypothetical protein BB31_15540 [Amycolatopsis lurida NRRL 2430]|uniref:Uncharacterized protein n=1 Tax=Amycolatopsis lurida NRRL 2430 TaxID=1460371 RepID=A0A2P2FU31_AMYLU|nr:hypothetical protein BB31_15540 [Amycolatopsis lurida NRRL 2430]
MSHGAAVAPRDRSTGTTLWFEFVTSPAGKTVPGGLLTGANWMSAVHPGRLRLDEELYRSAFTEAGVELTDLRRIPRPDTDYPEIWAHV